MNKLTKMERESREMARQFLWEPQFMGLIYIGGPQKGQFYVSIDRRAIGKKQFTIGVSSNYLSYFFCLTRLVFFPFPFS